MAVTVNGGAPSAPQIAEFQSTFQVAPSSHVSSGGAAHANVVAAGAAGGTTPSAQEIECCPENDVGASGDQALELIAIENNIFFQTTDVQVWFSGRNMQHYNNKYNMGAGGEVPYSYDVRLNRTPAGWEGPYPTSARPVVVP